MFFSFCTVLQLYLLQKYKKVRDNRDWKLQILLKGTTLFTGNNGKLYFIIIFVAKIEM